MYKKHFLPITALLLVIASLFAGRAEAQLRPSSAVLLPYFEVDLGGSGKTTLFAVGNVLDQPVEVQIEVRTNWGIPILTFPVTLAAHEVKSFNLSDWLIQGKTPGRAMQTAEKAQMKATLTGLKAPKDSLFYSTPVAPNLAVGSVVIRTRPGQPNGALWGDFLLIDPALKVSMGDDLINLDNSTGCGGGSTCTRHALRFISAKALSADTQVVMWTDRSAQPSKSPYPESQKVSLDGSAYNEAGAVMNEVHLRVLPLQMVSVSSLGLKEPFGWIDATSSEPMFIGLQFDSAQNDGAALQTYCLPPIGDPPSPDEARIELEKRTNGQDADAAPGPSIPVGAPVLWEYAVRNSGNSRLTQIEVEDDRGVQVTCPQSDLNPGDSMTCTGRGTAVACQYENLGTVTAKTPSGQTVSDEDPSHYFGDQNAKIDVETAVNGDDADTIPGPQVQKGSPLQWTYTVTNNGDVNLAEVKVTDDKGLALSCPKTSLRPGESMTCTASGTAASGQYDSAGAASGKPPCGNTVSDSDPVHYFGKEPGNPGLEIRKLTNGQHHTQAPGASVAVGSTVTWSYVVTNKGDVTLTNVKVTDDKVSSISCPKTTLQAKESMTCTASGTAAACQYVNTGTATGTPPSGPGLTAQDWGFYFGQTHPAIDVEKRTNGQDAPVAPGPMINVGSAVQWTYTVKNTGDVVLNSVTVTDDKGVAVSCPKTSLQPGESMTCTGNGTAAAGQYENTGTATGKPPCGNAVSDSDVSHYFGKQNPGLKIEKRTNGQRYTLAPGASVAPGSTVTWTYTVKNTGDVALTNVQVTDDKVGAITCPKTTLQAGESMTCTASGTAAACQYSNTGTATGTPPSGPNLTDQDMSYYFGQIHPAIDVEKLTNGQDAPTAPGPMVNVGSPVQWTYTVRNTGDVALSSVAVTDDKGVAVSCPKTSLQPGESMTCTGNGTATAGQYENTGTATGKPPCGDAVSDSDVSHYYGNKPSSPRINIKKYTNGEDADSAPGPYIYTGDPVRWTYVVTNTGDVALSNVSVTDDKGVAVSCPKTTLQPGEAMTCTGNGTATAGQYENIGTTTGTPPSGPNVTDTDPSHYYGKTRQTTGQGCTPGYWKNHTDSWPPTGYLPYQKVKSVFDQAAIYSALGNASLLDALSFQGGSTLQGAAEILLRAGVAALLDAAHPNVNYPRSEASVIADVNAALASGDRDTMTSVASALDRDNNLGCPLH